MMMIVVIMDMVPVVLKVITNTIANTIFFMKTKPLLEPKFKFFIF